VIRLPDGFAVVSLLSAALLPKLLFPDTFFRNRSTIAKSVVDSRSADIIPALILRVERKSRLRERIF
jgi:hypothetical protein